MIIQEIIAHLENMAPPVLQESYDNAGLLTGNASAECTGVLISLDATEDIVKEAVARNCNMIVAHHPIIFGGLKRITGKNYVEKTVIAAIKNDIAIYAIHTNLDNIIDGVSAAMADRLGLQNRQVLLPKKGILKKMSTYVPHAQLEALRNALFAAGAGAIGKYDECSFGTKGTGSYRAGAGADPFAGEVGKRHYEEETRLEMVFESWKEGKVLHALFSNHPYEEVAYEVISLDNRYGGAGSGLLGELAAPVDEMAFLEQLKAAFELKVVRHTPLLGKKVQKIALCGGAGSFLTGAALAAGADFYVTGDVKYHEFFDANGRLVIADIGHYESEQYSIGLLFDVLREKFPNFAVLKTGLSTNPVQYF